MIPIILVVVSYGCGAGMASSADEPLWVKDGEPKGFNPDLELVGTACAVSKRTADGMARRAIAEQIEVRVEGELLVRTKESTINDKTDYRESTSASARQTTRMTLPGVTIRKRYTDGHRVCSQAVMVRAIAVQAMGAELKALDSEIGRALTLDQVDAVSEVAAWVGILQKARQREESARVLCVLASRCGDKGAVSVSSAEQSLSAARARLVVDVRLKGDAQSAAGRDLLAMLSDLGVATTSNAKAPLEIRGTVNLGPGTRKANQVVFRAITAKIQLVRVSDGTALASVSWNDEVGQANRDVADRILLGDLKKRATKKFAHDVATRWRALMGFDDSTER